MICMDAFCSQMLSLYLAQAIDSYSHQRRNEELPNSALEDVVNRMFDKCLSDKSFKEVRAACSKMKSHP